MKKDSSSSEPQALSGIDQKSYKKELIIGSVAVVVLLALIATIAVLINNSQVKVIYEPEKACDMLTMAEAKELLGANTMLSGTTDPKLSGTTAVSKCGYTDGNTDTEKMIVAALMVRSGVNDEGVALNKSQFANGRPENTETVNDVGESAYFNKENGQLNVLDGHNWIIISYGQGTAQEANTIEDAVELAEKVLN